MLADLPIPPSFTPMHFVKHFPIGDYYCRALQSYYIDRSASKQQRDATVLSLIERQFHIEESDEDYGPLCIFPESSVTNGTNLQRFRRAAFQGGFPVQPAYLKYDWKTVSPDYATIKGAELVIMMCSTFDMQELQSNYFPVFVPNEYLYSNYAQTIPGHERMQRWEIYAHAVEDFIRTHGGFGNYS